MIKTEQQRWFVSCLIVSLLVHLGIVLMLTDIFRQRKSTDRLPAQVAVLSIEFKTLHLAKKDAQNQSTLSLPSRIGAAGGRSRMQPRRAPISKDLSNPAQPQMIAPQDEKSANQPPSYPEHPKLDLSKVLSDMRQVARESAENIGEQQLDRRKLVVNPENLKAPDSKPAEETENYTLPNGYQRRCVTKADGKKQCMSKEADDDSIWNAKIYLPDSLPPADSKSIEFARRLQQAIGKH